MEPLQTTTLATTLATTALATSTLPSRFRRRAYALAAALSLSAICSAELRVAFWPLLAAWPHAVLAHSSPRPLEGSGRAPRPSPGNGARSLAYMQGASHGTDKQRATAAKQNGDASSGRIEGREAKKTQVRCQPRQTRCLFNLSIARTVVTDTDYSVLLQRNVSSVQRR